ncbi:MAG: type II/IV secretion system protein [Ferrovibrio sp.]|jgi:pilus assembly protein CpaF|nr:Flp pilus assembly complex ATPase component TadA [Alphaproteobacteria bacterium]PJI42519.1 MAG: type II/IV secretion system protein [Ferrovibrio sp.]
MNAPVHGSDLMLRRLLEPLAQHYSDPSTIEIRMVRQEVVTTDRRGDGKRQIECPELSLSVIETICKALGNWHGLVFDPDTKPKLSTVLPGGHRFECLVGPSVQTGLSLAIRCKHPFSPSWQQLGVNDAVRNYLIGAVSAEKNIIVSGATNTGKTTLLNKLLECIPEDRRVIGVEDTPELHLGRFWDGVGLIAAREEGTGAGMITWRQIYDHLMRATPDHPILGEISTQNAFVALAILNSGMTGFMCSIHAESTHQAINRKFEQNIAWSGNHMPKVPEFLRELVDVVVQIKRSSDGWRRITDIYEPRNDRFILQDGNFLLAAA